MDGETKTGKEKEKENSRNIIVLFDMGAEEFAEFTVPKSLGRGRKIDQHESCSG